MSGRKSDGDRKPVVRDDDLFFEHHPDRQYRIRRASPVEVREKQLNGGLPPLPPGLRWFMVIRNVAPGRRIAPFAPHLEDAETDTDEETARAVFDLVRNDVPALEAARATRH